MHNKMIFEIMLAMLLLDVPMCALAVPLTSASEILGDLNGDGIVDLKDMYIASKALGSYPAHAKWDSRADVNGDNRVDTLDLYAIIRGYGKTARRVVNALVNVRPECLNLKSRGN